MLETTTNRLTARVVAALFLSLAFGIASAQGTEEEPVSITASVTPETAAPGDVVTVKVTAVIGDEYHIYGLPPVPEMTWPTQLVVVGPAGFVAEGETRAPPAVSHEDDTQGGDLVEWFTGTVTFELDVKVPADAEPGTTSLQIGLDHMACTEQFCLDPGSIETTAAKFPESRSSTGPHRNATKS